MSTNNNNDNTIGVKKSLHEMLTSTTDHIGWIVIPKLQRDYAQGRSGQESLRKRFLKSIFDTVDQGSPEKLELDFIFGHRNTQVIDHSLTTVFYPVDGQQRLTTLYLLHMYLGKRIGEPTDWLHFSYETRDSSKQFCMRLEKDIPGDKYYNIREYISDQWWYTGLWETDPTISSMITMLHEIDLNYRGKSIDQMRKSWYNLLHNVEFWLLYIGNDDNDTKNTLKASDSLYIKMNSRGKPLTNFEHLKAEIEGYANAAQDAYLSGEFSQQIDTTWTTLFWGYRQDCYDFTANKDPNATTPDYTCNGLDTKMLKFFRFYLTLEIIRNGYQYTKIDDKGVEHMHNYSYKQCMESLDILDIAGIVISHHKNLNVLHNLSAILTFLDQKKDAGGKLQQWFEQFITNKQEEERYETEPHAPYRVNFNVRDAGITDTDIFNMCICDTPAPRQSYPSVRQALVAEAFFHYMLHPNCTDHEGLIERLRHIRNLLANSEVQASEDNRHEGEMRGLLKRVDIIIETGIYNDTTHKDAFSGVQKTHEQEKDEWIAQHPADALLLKQVENHSLLRGNLSQLKGLTVQKLANFRIAFPSHRKSEDWSRIMSALLTFGDYGRRNDKRVVYGGKQKEDVWKQYIFANGNTDSLPCFDRFLKQDCTDAEAQIEMLKSFREQCQQQQEYTWQYYLASYPDMQNATTGRYLLFGEKYLYFMFDSSTCFHNDFYVHRNVYNNTLYSLFGSDKTEEDKHGGALLIRHGMVYLDVLENHIEIKLYDNTLRILNIKQNEQNIDREDRIELASSLINRIIQLADQRSQHLECPPETYRLTLEDLNKLTAEFNLTAPEVKTETSYEQESCQ